MKNHRGLWLSLPFVISLLISCTSEPDTEESSSPQEDASVSLKEETFRFTADTISSVSYVVYNQNKKEKRPVVIVVHEWWGLDEYPRSRARQLAEMGYLAVAVDLYGNGKTVDNPQDAEALAGPVYMNPQMALNRLNAALVKIKAMPQADSSNIAAIGYCFGGGLLLNVARLGADFDGVVSFHGNLVGTPARKDLLKSKILVCHGAADPFVPEQEVVLFKKSMDSVNASYIFRAYDSAMHSFTNPRSTERGKKFNIPIAYNAAADSASWNDMKLFLTTVFNQ